jgi:hypothetical protein
MIKVAEGVSFNDDGTLEGSLVAAARWVSMRRTTTLADEPTKLTAAQAKKLLQQLSAPHPVLQERSAALTLLSHLCASALKHPEFRDVADGAAQQIFALIDAEKNAALRAHAILLLSLRAPALSAPDRERAKKLLNGLVRAAPPYDQLKGPWRFAMCSGSDFHDGECGLLVSQHGFKKVESPAPRYEAFEAPFKNPWGEPIQILARAASVSDENDEMGNDGFVGLLVNRHAQLGTYDLKSAQNPVEQRGYKLMMNSECCGMSTRFAIQRRFPDADLYSSWDSTLFYPGKNGKLNGSEGLDCFVAVLQGMAHKETHAQLDGRIRAAQWDHGKANFPGFVQFVGPAHPLVLARFSDVNQDGRADLYDGFLDFELREIHETLDDALSPRDPGCTPSQIAGEAAAGLEWAAGSLDRASKYSEIWAQLPGDSEARYVFQAGGFYDQRQPPGDVPGGGDLGHLPSVCRYNQSGGLTAEVMFHSWLSHTPRELKRLLCAAEAMQRAFDLGILKSAQLSTPFAQRGAILLTMVGLLEFAADPNMVDAVWALALDALDLPDLSRSVVRGVISERDHEVNEDYYGSFQDLEELRSAIRAADPLALKKLESDDRQIGRARSLVG